MPIRAVTFDADETLWDVMPAPAHDDALHRRGDVRSPGDVVELVDRLAGHYVLGVIGTGNLDRARLELARRFAFWLRPAAIGIPELDPRMFAMAAAAAGCRLHELVHVGSRPEADIACARDAGARTVWLDRSGASRSMRPSADATIRSLHELSRVLEVLDMGQAAERGAAGVGPHPPPWPVDSRFDPELLAGGDRRNVVDQYRYWSTEAIVADLDQRRHPFHVAVENWRHDLNIGTVVRNANAFLAGGVHIVGRRRWNRRGAMVTDRYQHVVHHPTIAGFAAWAAKEQLAIIGIDNLPGATPLDQTRLPERCALLFGQEGPGLSSEARQAAAMVCSIRQFGSTRSINAGVASGIAMHAWTSAHAPATAGVETS